jgi:hypothetical protein
LVVVGKGEDGKELRERRSLDLMAALAFGRLWQHLAKATNSKKADERVERLVRRSLGANWGKARIEDHVEAIISGREPATADADTAAEAAELSAPTLFSRTARRFVVEVPKTAVSPGQVAELRAAFEALLKELEPVA